jgi:outer membrane protein assembly factor BamB
MTGPSDGFVLGVDLGTSHTVAMLRHPDGRTRPLLFDGQPLLPSATYLDAGGRLHVGADALRLGQADPARLEPHPKRRVDEGSVLLGETSVAVADLLAALLGAVAREATATAGFLPPAVLTCPASWGAARRAVLTEAITRAGWPPGTTLVAEPAAAARYFAGVLRRPIPVGGALAIFDFGGGTLDVAVVRHETAGRFTVAASGGADDLGGLDLDEALVNHLGKSLAGAEPAAWHALTEPATLAQWRARRQFWTDVRGAKEMLSRSSFAPVPVPGVEHALHLTRDELEAAADPLIRRGVDEAAAVIAAAGLAPTELAGLFLVGGSSRVPLVARLLHAELGIAPTVLEQPELPVAEGAILSAEAAGATTPSPPITDTRAGGYPLSVDPPPAEKNDDRQYAEPVDPWATEEARVLAAGGHTPFPVSAAPGNGPSPSSGPPSPPLAPTSWLASQQPAAAPPPVGAPPAGPPRRRRKRALLIGGAAALTVVVAAGAVLAWAFWPGYRSLDYHPLSEPRRIQPLLPVTFDWSDATIIDDRAYFASSDAATKRIGVIAQDLDADKPAWQSTEAGTATRWKSMTALPGGLALFTDTELETGTDTENGKRRMAYLGASDGKLRWERTLDTYDVVQFAGQTAVISDRERNQLVGVRLSDGAESWTLADPEGPSSSVPAVIPVTTPADLGGPALRTGRPLHPDLTDDPRLVVIGGDRSVQVLDADTGKVLTSRQNVAEINDAVVAHNGRLLVLQADNQQIASYDLEKLGEPRALYTAQQKNTQMADVTACGDDRICFSETVGYENDTATVVALDVTGDGEVWRYPLGDVDSLVPVGEAVIATTTDSETTLISPAGQKVWTSTGEAARLDGGNLLEFSAPLSRSAGDLGVSGRHIGDQAVPLGTFRDIRTDTCAWSTSTVACVADKDFVLHEFTG